MKKNNDERQLLSRVITFLSREELDFIDKVSKDSLFTTGTKLPRAKVIEAMVEAIREAGVNGDGVHSKEELIKKIAGEIAKKTIEEIKKKSLASE